MDVNLEPGQWQRRSVDHSSDQAINSDRDHRKQHNLAELGLLDKVSINYT